MLFDPRWKPSETQETDAKDLLATLQGGVSQAALLRSQTRPQLLQTWSRKLSKAVAAHFQSVTAGIRKLTRQVRAMANRRRRRAIASVKTQRERRARALQLFLRTERARNATAMMALEPRIVFDAAAGVTADAAVDQIAEQQAADIAFGEPESLPTNSNTHSHDTTGGVDVIFGGISGPASNRAEIIFIDPAVEDTASLIAGIDPSAEVIFLDADQDGVAQIAAAVAGRQDIDAIHILSHGAPGEITLGNAVLDAASIEGKHADELAAIRTALSAEADLLIYGCDFGVDAAVLLQLATATGADVAASTDDTGAAALEGDWDLEVATGAIETDVIEAEAFSGLLTETAPANSFATLLGGGTVTVDGVNVTLTQTNVNDSQAFTADGNFPSGLHMDSNFDTNGDQENIILNFDADVSQISLDFFAQQDEELITFVARDQNGSIVTISATSSVQNHMNTPFGGASAAMSQAALINGQTQLRSNLTDVINSNTSASFGSDSTATLIFDAAIRSLEIIHQGVDRGVNGVTNYNGTIIGGAFDLTATPSLDTDGDGIADINDVDDDNDGILDTVESLGANILESGDFELPDVVVNRVLDSGTVDPATQFTTDAGFTAFSTNGTVDWTEGQYTTFSSALISQTQWDGAIVTQSPAGGGFAIFSVDQEAVFRDLSADLVDGVTYQFSAYVGILPVYNHISANGSPSLDVNTPQFGVSGVGADSQTLGVTEIYGGSLPVLSNFPTNAQVHNATPASPIELNPDWREVTYTFTYDDAAPGAPQVFFRNNGGNSVITVDGLAIQAIDTGRDTDGDGIINSLDIDSDNDGITDNIEAQATAGYIAPSGTGNPDNGGSFVDANRDGLDDNFDAGLISGNPANGHGFIPANTDSTSTSGSDSIPDYLDADSDGDGISDNAENGLGQAAIAHGTLSDGATDTDGDGLFDQYETAIDSNVNDGFIVNEGIADPAASGSPYLPDADGDVAGATPLSADLDYRDATFDNAPPVAVDDPDGGATPAVTETVTGSDLTGGLSGNTVTVVDASNTLTFSVANGPDPLMNDAPFGVGFARNSGAADNTLEVSLLNGVDSIDLEFGFLNNDDQPSGSDGIEQLANFQVFDLNGVDITSQVTFALADNSTQGGLAFEATSSLNGQPNALVPDGPAGGSAGSFGENTNGILTITTTGPAIGSVQFTHQNLSDTRDGSNDPFGVVLEGVTYTKNATGGGTAYETDEDTSLSISVADGVVGNDSDPDGDTLNVTRVTSGTNEGDLAALTDGAGVGSGIAGSNGGLVTINADGSVDFDPDGDFDGLAVGESTTTSVVYQIDDGNGGTDQAVVTITINGVNDPVVPVDPTDPTGPTDPNDYIPVQIGVDATAQTPLDLTPYFGDGDTNDTVTLSIIPADLPAGLTFNPLTNTISGTPDPDASQGGPNGDGVHPITVTATDGNGSTITTVVTYTITNPAPVAVNDALMGDEDTTTTNDLTPGGPSGQVGQDNDPDGDTINVTRVASGNTEADLAALADGTGVGAAIAGSNGGSFTVAADGTVSFNPGDDFNGLAVGQSATTEIVYQIDDGNGGTDQAVVTYTVAGENDAPIPVDPTQPPIDPNNPPTGTPFDPQDPHAPPLDPQNYIPAQTGSDSTVQPGFDVTPYFGDPDSPDTVTLTIPAGELPPGLTFDGTSITGTPTTSASQGGDDPVNAPGVYIIPVTATDPSGATFTTNVTYTIINPAPIAINDALTGDEDTITTNDLTPGGPSGQVGQDNDPDGDTINVTRVASGNTETDLAALADGTGVGVAVAGSNGGSFTVAADGTVSFDPGIDFQGLDVGEMRTTQIVYQIDDGEGGADTAVVTYTVTGVNDAPVVIEPTNPGNPLDPTTPTDPNNVIADQTGEDSSPLTPLDVSPFFADVDGEPLTFSFNPADTNVPTWLAINPATGIITGTPPADASQFGPNNDGVYPITIIATDPDGTFVTTTVDFTINNPAPVALDDGYTASEDAPITIPAGTGVIASNDTDPDGDALFVSAVDGVPANVGVPIIGTNGGEFTVNPDGSISFDPAGDFEDLGVGETATTTLQYTVSDGDGGTDTATITVTVEGVNDTPVVNGPIGPQSGTDGVTITPIDTTVAFTNPNGDPLTFTVDNLPPGLVIDAATGEISGTPAFDASQGGPYTVTVTAVTPTGETASTTFVYAVENPDPMASDDQTATGVDVPVTINPLGNDIDPDDDPLTIASAGPSTNGGTVTVNPDGTVDYTPPAGFTGTDTFTYAIDDGNGGTDTATVTIEVGGPSADVPATTGLTAQENVDGDTITPVDVSSAFTDPNGDPLTIVAAGLPAGLVIDPMAGIITGTIDPSASQAGLYPVVITATDPNGNQISTTFDWAVSNPVPVAADDTASTPLDTPLTFSPLGNDTDPDGDELTVEAVGTPDNGGTVSVNPDGTLTYTPATGFAGTETFTYTVTDADGATDTATVTVVVDGTVPGAPEVTVPPVSQVNDDGENITPVDVSTSFNDPDGDPLTFTAEGLPEGLSIDPATGGISGTIDPDASAAGPYDVVITATDPDGNVASTTVPWTVNNPAPDAIDDSASTLPDTPVTINVLGNDSDPDDDSIAVVSDGPLPSGATVVINPDGTLTYTPPTGFTGVDTFTYTVEDGNGGTDTATVTVTVEPVPTGLVSDPVIPAQTQNDSDTPTPIDVSALVSDPDGDPLTFTVDNLPPGLTLNPVTGIISGTLDHSTSQGGPNGDGVYPVTITATDPGGSTTTIFLPYTVLNPAPDAQDDDVTTDEDSTLSGTVFSDNGNGVDEDPDGDPITVTQVNGMPITSGDPITLPSGAILTMNDDGTYAYNPNDAFESLGNGQTGTDTFTYQISDGEGGFDTATVNLTVDGVNDAPVAFDDEVTTLEDVPVTFDPRENDTDVENDPLTITEIDGMTIVVDGPGVPVEGGEITLNPDGTITFTPTPDYNGTPSFTYTVADPDGLTATATVRLDVTPVADRNFAAETPDVPSIDDTPTVTTDDLGAELIVVETVESFGGLGSRFGIERSFGSRQTDIDQLGRRFAELHSRYGFTADPFAAGGLIGFSLRSDVSGLEETGGSVAAPQVVVDTLMRQGQLFVEITNTIDSQMDQSATRYDVTRPDGKPLPGWVQHADDGLLMANVPADMPPVDLRIVVTLEDGSFVEQSVRIQTSSGEVQPVDTTGHVEQAAGFSEQIKRTLGADFERIQKIERTLQLQRR